MKIGTVLASPWTSKCQFKDANISLISLAWVDSLYSTQHTSLRILVSSWFVMVDSAHSSYDTAFSFWR